MKLLLSSLLILGCVAAAVVGLTLAGKPESGQAGAKPTARRNVGPRQSNALGDLIAGLIYSTVADLGDPYTVIADPVTIPILLEDTITVDGNVTVSNVTISKISTLNVTTAMAALIPLGGSFSFHLPEVVLTGNYDIEFEVVTSLFPIPLQGAGTFSVKVTEGLLNTVVKLKSGALGHLAIASLVYDMDVWDIELRLEGLFSDLDDGQLNEAVNKVLNAYISVLFTLFEAQYHDDVAELVMDVGNLVLANVSLADLIEWINNPKTTTTTAAPFILNHDHIL